MAVFVLDKRGKPLMPCSEKRARQLLERGRARVHKLTPFAIRLVDRLAEDIILQPVRLKVDPGSMGTGLAIVRESSSPEGDCDLHVIALAEIIHRGALIGKKLAARRSMRRARRSRKTRYRAARFTNRRRPAGWLAPSLKHRVVTTEAWVGRYCSLAPITALSLELVRFDLQKMENPEIRGVEYQQGTLAGYELREYLLEKWGRQCAYCDATDTPLEIDHIVARAQGGSDRVSNLCLACHPCNQKKAKRPLAEFLNKDTERVSRILAMAKAPLRDAAAVNATRWELFNGLKSFGRPIETASGGRTKYNRQRLALPKSHAFDAMCVGRFQTVISWNRPTLQIKCAGRGSYQRTRLTAVGFPRGYLMRRKSVFGFQTGDMVSAEVTAGKNQGRYVGRVAVRASGSFNIQTSTGVVQGISYRHCNVLQRGDGYGYSLVAQKPGKES